MAATVIQFECMTPLDDLQGAELERQAIIRVGMPARRSRDDCRDLCRGLLQWLQPSKYGKPHFLRMADSWEGFCARFATHDVAYVDAMLAGYHALDKDEAIPIQRAVDAAKARQAPQQPHGGARSPTAVVEQVDKINLTAKPSKGGTGSAYLLSRLARDYPDMVTAYERGEYPSVRAVAKAAGIVKEKTPLEHVQSWWRRCTPAEQAAFLQDIQHAQP